MNVNKKIIEYLDFKGVSQRQFTTVCKLSEGVLRRGKNIGSGYLNSIKTNYPDLSMDWLLFNEGKMLLEENSTHPSNLLNEDKLEYNTCKNCENLKKDVEHLKELILAKEDTIQVLKHQLGMDNGNSKAG